MLPGGILYAKLAAFNREDVDAFETSIDKALAQPGQPQPRGMILDLRGNPGGFVKAANMSPRCSSRRACSLRIKAVSAIRSLEKRPRSSMRRFSPMIRRAHMPASCVICHWLSSSITPPAVRPETVTAALKDNNRARVIGEKSYGKSIAYDNFPQDFGGSLELTIAIISSPNGYSWQGQGLTPDLLVVRPRTGSADVQLDAAVAALR